MSGERGIIGEDHAVTDPAVMGDMHIGHERAFAADTGDATAADRAATKGAALANDIAIADLKASGLACVLKVLWRLADGTELEYLVIGTDACRAIDHHVRADPGAVADLHIRSDDGECADLHALTNFRAWIDDGLRVDHLFEFLVRAHEFRRTGQLITNVGFAFIHPDATHLARNPDLETQLVAWLHLALEARLVDTDEKKTPYAVLSFIRQIRQDPAGLGHGLDHQNAGHYRAIREVPGKERLIDSHVLDGGERFTFRVIQHPVDEQERVAMREHLHYFVDIETILQRFSPLQVQSIFVQFLQAARHLAGRCS